MEIKVNNSRNLWFIVLIISILSININACSTKSDVKTEESQLQVKTYLDAVPNDSAWVLWSNGSIPVDITSNLLRTAISKTYLHSCNGEEVEGKGRFFWYLLNGINQTVKRGDSGTVDYRRLETIGLSPSPTLLSYSVGEYPVVRIGLSNPEKFNVFLESVESKVSNYLDSGTTDWVKWHKVSNTPVKGVKSEKSTSENDLVYAVVGKEFVITLLPRGEVKTPKDQLVRVFGLDVNEKSTVPKLRVNEATDVLKTNSFVGYLDADKFLQFTRNDNIFRHIYGNLFSSQDDQDKDLCVQSRMIKRLGGQPYVTFGIDLTDSRGTVRLSGDLNSTLQSLLASNIEEPNDNISDMVLRGKGIFGFQGNFRVGKVGMQILQTYQNYLNDVNRECGVQGNVDFFGGISGLIKNQIGDFISGILNMNFLVAMPASEKTDYLNGYFTTKFDDLNRLSSILSLVSLITGSTVNLPLDGKVYPFNSVIKSPATKGLPSKLLDNLYLYSDPRALALSTKSYAGEAVAMAKVTPSTVKRPMLDAAFDLVEFASILRAASESTEVHGKNSSYWAFLDKIIAISLDRRSRLILASFDANDIRWTAEGSIPTALLRTVFTKGVEVFEKKVVAKCGVPK